MDVMIVNKLNKSSIKLNILILTTVQLAVSVDWLRSCALFVEPHRWKSGIGRALIEHCSEMGRVRGAAVLHVIGNPHAEGFYRSCGFVQTGTVATQFGEGLLMVRAL